VDCEHTGAAPTKVGVGGGSVETRVELEAIMDEAPVDEVSTTMLDVTKEDEIVPVFDRLVVNEEDEIVPVSDRLLVDEEDEIVSVIDMLDGVDNPYEIEDIVVVGKNAELDKNDPFPDGEEIDPGVVVV